MQKIDEHKRINDILLGPLERPALAWLAEHMPRWVTPDLLTLIGLFASLLIFVSYWLTQKSSAFLWLASFGFILNWFGDSLDGTLARHRKIERPKYGFFVDHIIDAIDEVMVFLGLGLSPYVTFTIANLALVAYLLISVQVYISTAVHSVFKISYGKLGPTEIRLIAILANTVIFFLGNPLVGLPYFGQVALYDVIVGAVAAILMYIFISSSILQMRTLAKEDSAHQDKKK
ncbi:MAG: CDP-alcohol phosphatidyltransferase family protein [Anaerolineaceae bacterium]|nr:CDP-alcohol phosphatidyltransferase family protein [Anaerolineaceae bacterium]MBN2676504.1 CDP-alcohol phosphatidyltransferase family protein [Anaerolineaceae bacterium]